MIYKSRLHNFASNIALQLSNNLEFKMRFEKCPKFHIFFS